jgi:hypothetical protein
MRYLWFSQGLIECVHKTCATSTANDFEVSLHQSHNFEITLGLLPPYSFSWRKCLVPCRLGQSHKYRVTGNVYTTYLKLLKIQEMSIPIEAKLMTDYIR